MRPLASAVLALSLTAAARAADLAAPTAPTGPVPISAPVLSALSLQLGELSKMKTAAPVAIALRLANLAKAPGPEAGAASSAASALLIKQALTDSRALKALFDSLQEARTDQAVAASHSLADLRESVYAGASPEAVRAAMKWSLGPLEEKLNAGKPLSFADLAAVYDHAPSAASGAEPVRAEPGAPGQGKIDAPLKPSSRPAPAARSQAPSARQPQGEQQDPIVLEGIDSEAVKAALLAAANRVGTLPPGVNVVFRGWSRAPDNPQVSIYVDGRKVYWEYLYHSEASLARLRLKWNSPSTWLEWSRSRKPSPDLSKRFEAALRLAIEGAPVARAKAAAAEREPAWTPPPVPPIS